VKILVNPIQHPGAIVRGVWSKEPCQETYLRRLWKMVNGETPRPPINTNQPPRDSTLFPTISDLREFSQIQRKEDYDGVSVDIENAGRHIICVGLCLVDLRSGRIGPTVCVRFRRRGGKLYWRTRRELLQAVEWLYEILDDSNLSKIFHNGVVYDVPILKSLGFSVRGRLIDTMNLAHACYPELSKGLQFCATLYLWSPVWKTLTDEVDEGDGKA